MINNYNDLTLETYLQIDAILNTDTDEIGKQVGIVALLSGKTEDEVLTMPLAEYSALAAQTDFLRHECPPVSAPSRLICGELVLLPVQDFKKITTAQYVDFQTFVKGGTAKLAELLGCLLVPEGHTYNEGYDIAVVIQAVKGLPLPVALSLAGFFFGLLVQSIADSLISLEKNLTMVTKDRAKAETIRDTIREARMMLSSVGLQI